MSLSQNTVRGLLGEYTFDEDYFDQGGFAVIYRARSKERKDLALKRLHAPDEEAVARLRREIQEQSRIHHPAVMPIVDHDPSFQWFVMPLADENLVQRWNAGPISDELLLEILETLARGLSAAHALGLVHRDVSQRNILRIGAQWVVADWGVVRRAPGFTTMVRTQGELGTNGFAAPELFRTAHNAGPSADVYSLGRIAAWVVTREWPELNIPLLPAGPWRHFVRRTTEHEAVRRPQTMDDVIALLGEVARELRGGSNEARSATRSAQGDSCLEDCLLRPDDAEIHLDHLYRVEGSVVASWVERRARDLGLIVQQLEAHLLHGAGWGGRGFDAVGSRIAWLRLVAQQAAAHGNDGLLEDVVGSLLRAEAHWERFPERHATREWLESISGAPARTVARVLRREVEARRWLLAEGWFPDGGDAAIVAACERGSAPGD